MKRNMVGDPETREYLWDKLYNIIYVDILSSNDEIEMSADVDFNFSDGKIKSYSGIVEDEKLKEKLTELNSKYHYIENFSIIPKSGAINDKKGKCDNDRFDRYFYLLKILLDAIQQEGPEKFYADFYESVIAHVEQGKKFNDMDLKYYLINAFPGRGPKGCSKVEKYKNQLENLKKPLIDYLGKYTFDEYSKKFYKIVKDSELYSGLLQLGKIERLLKKEDVKKYTELAEKYWDNKRKIYLKDISDMRIKELNERVAQEYK